MPDTIAPVAHDANFEFPVASVPEGTAGPERKKKLARDEPHATRHVTTKISRISALFRDNNSYLLRDNKR